MNPMLILVVSCWKCFLINQESSRRQTISGSGTGPQKRQPLGVAWDLSQLSSLRPDLKTVVQISKRLSASVVAPPGWGRETAPLHSAPASLLWALRSAPPFPGPSQAPQPTPAGQLFWDLANCFEIWAPLGQLAEIPSISIYHSFIKNNYMKPM